MLSIIFYWFDKGDIALIFAFQILISICAGSIFPLLWSMYADCADYSELKTGNRATGLVFSSSSMSQKFGWAIGTAVTGWLLAYFWVQAQCRTKRGDHSWHQDVFEFSPCDRYDTECFIYQYVSVE